MEMWKAVENSAAEIKVIPYEIEKIEFWSKGIAAFVRSLQKAAQIHLEGLHRDAFS